ncbi:MAG TPA: hypothetical protein VER39_06190 [Nocardioidaceae bacterium]|nr:hypothetical protein [Nocardioidaceae bacterium]
MSTTINRFGFLPRTVLHRSPRRVGRLRTLQTAAQRRRHLAAQRAHGREDRTDAYLDRSGEPDVDPRNLVAHYQR